MPAYRYHTISTKKGAQDFFFFSSTERDEKEVTAYEKTVRMDYCRVDSFTLSWILR
ncbi:hypothetical cytosolic protein [Syntrophus aciditrophicus SB]|uniref:Hypothetical cytosolic protein n=1 Tax=Syntrophus aciditrophicus (strain SB) TaxID=56780 RepID=Q2LR70_SYNAS|nr:hypothetical cytosolic protein [Syntrophus aciditrophicus SB]